MNAAAEQLVTIVLVTYNSAHCMAAHAQRLSGFSNIAVVDNGSGDDIAQQVALHLPGAQLIALPKNLGFGAANNIALRQLQTPFALLLNPDCLIDAADVQCLLQAAEDFPKHAIIAPQVWRNSEHKELSYRFPSTYWAANSTDEAQAACCVGFVTGAAMLLRVSAFEGIGFFDENFFLYYEDEDLCLRCFNAGRAPVLVPQAKALHISRSSVKEGFPYRSQYIRGYHHAQSKIMFTAKHIGVDKAKALRLKTLSLALLGFPFRLLWPDLRYVVRLWGRIRGLIAYESRSPLS